MFLSRFLRRVSKLFKIFSKFGFQGVLDDFLNFTQEWNSKKSDRENIAALGSISGEDFGYLSVVNMASSNPTIFTKFKSNVEYRRILEHVDRTLGKQYLETIQRYGTTPEKLIDFIKEDYCKPFRYTYGGVGRVSPSNLRYAKVALDIRALFGSLDNFRVAEIGIGYGGQFQALSTLSNIRAYYFYDLPNVVKLAQLYINQTSPNLKAIQPRNFNLVNSEVDLVISNYAFSELNRNLQEVYLQNIILFSKRGYLIYNDIGKADFDTIDVKEFASRIPGAIIVNEHPISSNRNRLVVWGHENISDLIIGE